MSGGYPPNHNILLFSSNSDFIIPYLILTPLSLSPSCRRPVPLQEGPRGLTASRLRIQVSRPSPSSSPQRRINCSTSSSRPPAPAASDGEEASDLITGGGAEIRRCRQPWTWRRCHLGAGRRAHAIQDIKTSARSSHRPSSPWQEGILTLKSFMIPYPKLCDLLTDIAGGLAMISWSISWSTSWSKSWMIS